MRWYSCYKRGISLAREKECLEDAQKNFLNAIQQKSRDKRWVRTYGMHRLPEYFPNRELGIAYYHLNKFDLAIEYLEKSNEYCESAKAKFYINKVRKKILDLTQEDIESPRLFIDPNALKPTATPIILLSGEAEDDTYVANILIRVNNEQPLSLMELSRPGSFNFRQKIILQPGLNDIFIIVLDLLGKEERQRIQILLDQEGPMIYFAEPGDKDFNMWNYIQGLIFDPSDIVKFTLNEKEVELIKIEADGDPNAEVSEHVYWFKHRLSLTEWEKGILSYRAEDSLQNISEGILSILMEKEEAEIQRVYSHNNGLLRIALASKTATIDLEGHFPFRKIAKRRNLDPIRIKISQIPRETFEEEIAPQIEILASRQIRDVYINELPILSMYGASFAKLFTSIIKRYLDKREEGKFLFPRMFKLKEGENIIKIKVVDQFGDIWEKTFLIIKKVKKIHKLDERWRIAIPLIYNLQEENNQKRKNKLLTFQLIKAFIKQSRFKVIEFENIPIIIREKDLHHYIGSPFLGLQEECRIWIDAFLLGYFQETEDSFTLLASLVDLETGEILATKDIFEGIDPIGPLETEWEEELREHTFQNCCALATKIKNHFPLCEGRVIHITEEILDTSICKYDGLKRGMKLIVYDDQNPEEDIIIIGEAKVREVLEKYSYAEPLEKRKFSNIKDNSANWWVITR